MNNNSQALESTSASKQAEAIQIAQHVFAARFPGQDFAALTWDLSSMNARPGVSHVRKLNFVRLKASDQPLPEIYASVIKSWLVLEGNGSNNQYEYLLMARYLWEVLLKRRQNRAENFQWESVVLKDLRQAEQSFLSGHLSPEKAYGFGTTLTRLVTFLWSREICPTLHFTLQIPAPQQHYPHIIIRAPGEKDPKLPSQRALEGIADIFHERAKEPPARLLVAALALLAVSGFRIGELLTMPFDCEVEEQYRGKLRYGLRHFREKSRGGVYMPAIRWLTPIGEELARKAIADIRTITAPFREQAQRLEADPEHISIPGRHWAEKLDTRAVQQLLGLNSFSTVRKMARKMIPSHLTAQGYYYYISDIEAYLQTQRKFLWTLDRRDGTYQMLSESLFIAPKFFFAGSKGANPFLIEPVTYHHIRMFLVGDKGSIHSAFERFDIHEEDGSVCRMTTHQFRHWLNDIADKGGLPVELQTRWLGRENPHHTPAYHHSSLEERLQWVKQDIRDGAVGGVLADVYFALPEEVRDVFLESQVQAVHFTPYGVCIHDFAIDPCPFHLMCPRGCRDYLRTKGNQAERTTLIQLRVNTEKGLRVAREAASKDNANLAGPWVQNGEQLLAGIDTALAVDDQTPEVSDGTVIQPFPDQPSKFEPL